MMDKIEWTASLSVGVTEIDEQHQRIFSIIDELSKEREDAMDSASVLAILRQLVDYSDYHFRSEDDYMIENSYPLFLSHRKEHLVYIRKMGDLIDALEKKGSSLSEDILEFLYNWWQTHIVGSDLKYARYIKAQKK
jgi:hemerythrin